MQPFTDRKIGCDRFHKSSQFDYINGTVPSIVKSQRNRAIAHPPFPIFASDSKINTLYPKKENCELPSWIINDKQVLSFDAYFEDLFEAANSAFRKRRVKILYFLEDGTIQVNEEKLKNCGFSQGTLIGRRRIPFPKSMDKVFYEVIDFNIGKTVELLGRTFHILDCDKFTRHWLNRSGVAVPDSLLVHENQVPDEKSQQKARRSAAGHKPDKLGQFLKYDGHVLRFFAYWDDRESMEGDIRKLIVQYYLSDDTIDVREEAGSMLLARTRLPKDTSAVAPPGSLNDTHLLNVLTTGYLNGRTVKDSQHRGPQPNQYYSDADLLPGVTLNIYGRAVILTDCDPFTRDFYKAKYGIDQFKTVPIPPSNGNSGLTVRTHRELPPWNGFGTFEDSAGNCTSLVPRAMQRSGTLQFSRSNRTSSDREGVILRFRARMIANNAIDSDRVFIVSFYLADNTTSVFEMAPRNSGFEQRMFIKRKEAFKPTETLLVSRKPSIYTKEDFWVGNKIEIDKFQFELVEADEFTTSFMGMNHQEALRGRKHSPDRGWTEATRHINVAVHNELITLASLPPSVWPELEPPKVSHRITPYLILWAQFPKSNIDLILDKVRAKLSGDYKSFVQKYLLPDGEQTISEAALSAALKTLMGDTITCHEIAALAKHFTVQDTTKLFDKEKLRDVCRNECRRHLYSGFDRLSENLHQLDGTHTGYLARNDAYGLCRGAGIPVDRVVMAAVFQEVDRNEKGHVSIQDLLTFFDPSQNPCTSLEPFNQIREFSNQPMVRSSPKVDCVKFIKSLRLEEALKNEI